MNIALLYTHLSVGCLFFIYRLYFIADPGTLFCLIILSLRYFLIMLFPTLLKIECVCLELCFVIFENFGVIYTLIIWLVLQHEASLISWIETQARCTRKSISNMRNLEATYSICQDSSLLKPDRPLSLWLEGFDRTQMDSFLAHGNDVS